MITDFTQTPMPPRIPVFLQKISEHAVFFSLCAFLSIAPNVVPIFDEVTYWHFRTTFIHAGSGTLFLLWWWLHTPKCTYNIHAIIAPFCLCILWAAITLLWTRNIHTGWPLLFNWLSALAVYTVAVSILTNRIRIRIALWCVTASAAVGASIGLLQYLFDITWVPQVVAPAALSINKNMAAHLVTVIFPIAVWLWHSARSYSGAVFGASAAVILLWYLFFSTTRAAWLALAVATIVSVVCMYLSKPNNKDARQHTLQKKYARPIGIYSAIALSIAIYMAAHNDNIRKETPLTTATETIGDFFAANQRNAIWANSTAMLFDTPIHALFGYGLGSFAIEYGAFRTARIPDDINYEKGQRTRSAHNDWLQLTIELGFFLWLPLGWLLFLVCRNLSNLLHKDRSFAVALVAAFIAFSVNASFSFPLQLPVIPLVLAVLCAVLHNDARQPISGSGIKRHHNPARFIRYTVFMTFVSVTVLLWGYTVRSNTAQQHHARARTAFENSQWAIMAAHADNAITLAPWRKDTLYLAALAQERLGNQTHARTYAREHMQYYPFEGMAHIIADRPTIPQVPFVLHGAQHIVDIDVETASAQTIAWMQEVQALTKTHKGKAAVLLAQGTHYAFDDAKYFGNIGALLQNLGYFNDARLYFSKAVSKNPTSEYKGALGWLYFQTGDSQKGLVMMQEAITKNPTIHNADIFRRYIETFLLR